jgi:hypothetical protein
MHLADANEAELAVMKEFFTVIDCLVGPAPGSLSRSPRAHSRTLSLKPAGFNDSRRVATSRGSGIYTSTGPPLGPVPVSDVALPHFHHCLVSFCDETPDPEIMEAHLAEFHPEVHQVGLYHTEVQLQLPSLLGLGLEVEKKKAWRCSFRECKRDFDKFIEMYDHVQDDHSSHEKSLYNHVGGFWRRFSATTIDTGLGRW